MGEQALSIEGIVTLAKLISMVVEWKKIDISQYEEEILPSALNKLADARADSLEIQRQCYKALVEIAKTCVN